MKNIMNGNMPKSTNLMLTKLIASTVLALLFAGCGSDKSSDPITQPIEQTEKCAGMSLDEGYQCLTVGNRDSIIYSPVGQELKGLALFLHGSPGNAKKVMGIFDAKMLAESYNLLALSPKGNVNMWGWLSSNNGQQLGNADTEFLAELITQAKAEHNITSDKLYVFGYSAGGFMAYKLACYMPEQISAVISLAGQYRGELDACITSSAVNLHHFHSPTDKEVPFDGRSTGEILSVNETIEHWQQINGCDLGFDVIEHPGVTNASSGTMTERYQNCAKTVVLSKMTGVAHEASYLPLKLLDIYGYLLEQD